MPNEALLKIEGTGSHLGDYRGLQLSGYDELINEHGDIRAPWRALMAGIEAWSPEQIRRQAERVEKRIRDTGIDFDIFAHPTSPTQNWRLDLLPIMLSSAEWQWLERALCQRAQLLNLILKDIYGEQRLMRSGMIPPELVFSDPTYLKACQGILPDAGPLRFFAADLARDHNGQWRIIDNHTETLAGLGFAVANRVVHSHVTGDLFRRCNAKRLAPFFWDLQNALADHAGRGNARIALLTPGPHHQDYFSHAYLARYLGYLLVEGSDLRTKGNQIYLKTLEGFKEIDLLVRCVDGRFIDPLELDFSGVSGTAGLLFVNRAKPHLVVNAVGSAVVQNRGLGPYLGALARELLGEDLLLPDARRHWLGDMAARGSVLGDLDNYVIRIAQEGTGRPGQAEFGERSRSLSGGDRDRLVELIGRSGDGLVAEEEFGFSQAPSFNGTALVPRSFAIRFFVAHTKDGFQVMPGGLAMSVDAGSAVALSATDAHTRDVWVAADTKQGQHVSLWRPRLENARVERSQRVIQSRVADDLYWLGRYTERADWTMRVLRGAYRRIEEDSDASEGLIASCKALLALLDSKSGVSAAMLTASGIEQLSKDLIAGPKASRTLVHTAESLYRCANLARDRLSFEAWHALKSFRPGDAFIANVERALPSEALDLLDDGLLALSAFNGLMHENMTRNFGWRFLDLGRRIERAYNLSELIAQLFSEFDDVEEETEALRLVLEVADSFITYRSRYRIDPSLPLVLDLLLLDESNPRSLAYQLAIASTHLEAFPGNQRGIALNDDGRLLLGALTAVRLADVAALTEPKNRWRLASLMAEQLSLLPELSNAIGRHYFNLTDDMPHRVHSHGEVGP